MKRHAGFLHDRDYRRIKTDELADFDGSPITTDDLLRLHLVDLKEGGRPLKVGCRIDGPA